MRLGLIARADNTGLGIQTHEFYKNMHPAKTMVVDISELNGYVQSYDRYDKADTVFIRGFPTDANIKDFLKDLDVVFLAEAPYNFALYTLAKEMGVKVANQYNYEFFDWFANPHLPTPDMLIAPSMWNYDVVDQFCRERGIQHVYLHCPVNRQELPFRQIPRARKFIHNAGRAAAHDRNGTMSVIHASSMLRTNAEIVIRFQGQQGLAHQSTDTIEDYQKFAQIVGAKNLTILVSELSNYADSYNDGDVMVLPRRYGGNCLPLNEALSVGMPVLMTDISPNNYLLPKNWLIPSHKVTEFTPRTQVDIYGADPLCLAQKIDEFYRMDEKDMLDENDTANGLADSISWDTLRPEYERVFEELCSQQ